MLKKILRPYVYSLCGNLYSLTRRAKLKNALTVFCYHDVNDKPSEFSRLYELSVSRGLFERQLKFIKNNFNIISPDEMLLGKIPVNAAMVTFDDGFKSYFKTAIPIMEEYNIPSLIFLNMASVSGGVFYSGLITYLCREKDFCDYLSAKIAGKIDKPLFLYCRRIWVEEYLQNSARDCIECVKEFIGEFASLDDIEKNSRSPLVFYGNHLFDHEVPVLMSDEDLLKSFDANEAVLSGYQNYRRMFSFPFGQPDICYKHGQVALLNKRAQKIFSSAGYVNNNADEPCLDRVAMSQIFNSTAKMWFQVCRNL
jgi:hypothetical protein